MARFARLLFWTLDAFVAGLFVLAWIGRHVRPDAATWPLQLVAIGFPYLSVAVAALLLVQLLRRNWRSAAVHAVLLAFAALRYAGPAPPEASGGAPADTLALLTYNVAPFFGSPETKAEELVAYVGAVRPDVVLLQETNMRFFPDGGEDGSPVTRVQGQGALLRPRLGYEAPFPVETGGGAPINFARIATLARPPARGMTVVTLGRTPNAHPIHQFVRTEHTLGGRRLALYNVHLRSYGSEKPWSDSTFSLAQPATWRPFLGRYRASIIDRALEADTLRALVLADSLPVVVAGDFNSTMHNWTYRQVLGAGLLDAWRAEGEGWGGTYHVRAPIARIDFVLADPRLRVLSASLDPDAGLSDHHPLLVRLAWRDPPGG